MRLYNLTPIGDGWGYGMRILEVIGQTLSLIFIAPIVAVHNGTGAILERLFR